MKTSNNRPDRSKIYIYRRTEALRNPGSRSCKNNSRQGTFKQSLVGSRTYAWKRRNHPRRIPLGQLSPSLKLFTGVALILIFVAIYLYLAQQQHLTEEQKQMLDTLNTLIHISAGVIFGRLIS